MENYRFQMGDLSMSQMEILEEESFFPKKNRLVRIILASTLVLGFLIAEPFVYEGLSNSRSLPEDYILIENPRGSYSPIE